MFLEMRDGAEDPRKHRPCIASIKCRCFRLLDDMKLSGFSSTILYEEKGYWLNNKKETNHHDATGANPS